MDPTTKADESPLPADVIDALRNLGVQKAHLMETIAGASTMKTRNIETPGEPGEQEQCEQQRPDATATATATATDAGVDAATAQLSDLYITDDLSVAVKALLDAFAVATEKMNVFLEETKERVHKIRERVKEIQ